MEIPTKTVVSEFDYSIYIVVVRNQITYDISNYKYQNINSDSDLKRFIVNLAHFRSLNSSLLTNEMKVSFHL